MFASIFHPKPRTGGFFFLTFPQLVVYYGFFSGGNRKNIKKDKLGMEQAVRLQTSLDTHGTRAKRVGRTPLSVRASKRFHPKNGGLVLKHLGATGELAELNTPPRWRGFSRKYARHRTLASMQAAVERAGYTAHFIGRLAIAHLGGQDNS
jgi:hypothetical protein